MYYSGKHPCIAVLFFGIALIMATTDSNAFASGEMGQQTQILITTTHGPVTILLYDDTPKHRDNFVTLAEDGFYDGLLFHRVIEGFMIQAGDPMSRDAVAGEPLGSGGPGHTIPAEFVPGLFHKKGAVAAARQGDHVNPERRSSGSQFYIVQGRTWSDAELDQMDAQRSEPLSDEQREIYTSKGGVPHLDETYTVFGQVVEGMEVIERIAAEETDERDRPKEDVRILKMEVTRN